MMAGFRRDRPSERNGTTARLHRIPRWCLGHGRSGGRSLICRREELRYRCQAKRPCRLFSEASSAWPWEQAAAHVVGSWHSGRGSLFCTCTLERRSRFSISADIGYLSSNRASALTANADPGLRDAPPCRLLRSLLGRRDARPYVPGSHVFHSPERAPEAVLLTGHRLQARPITAPANQRLTGRSLWALLGGSRFRPSASSSIMNSLCLPATASQSSQRIGYGICHICRRAIPT
ncbi:hypothetical protein L1887_51760 [Cichorium endivia]|nr:hypothetical protein L1887_51760 [Cichorium endivia]